MTARRPRHHRQHGAGIWRHLRLLPGRRRDASTISTHDGPRRTSASRWSRPMPRRRACGATPTRPTRSSPTRWSSISPTSCRRWPARSGRRTASPLDDVEGRASQGAMEKRVPARPARSAGAYTVEGADFDLGHGDVVIAAITSCTNTSNPSVLIGAGLLARNAVAKGLKTKPWVKTSLAPGSQVVAEYLEKAGLQERPRRARLQPRRLRLHHLHRQFRAAAGRRSRRRSTTTTSSPRRCSPATATSRAASTPTCRPTTSPRRRWSSPMRWPARCTNDLDHRAARHGSDGKPVYLKDIWPTSAEIAGVHRPERHARAVHDALRRRVQGRRELAGDHGRAGGQTYDWDDRLDLRAEPALFRGHDEGRRSRSPTSSTRASSASSSTRSPPTTSRPAGSIKAASPGRRVPASSTRSRADRLQPVRHAARQPRGDDARHLRQHPHQEPDGADGRQGRGRRHHPPSRRASRCRSTTPPCATRREGVPLVVFAGKEYGTGSSRDWAAKGTNLLGVRAVIAAELRAHPPLQPGRHGRRCRSCSRRARPGRRSA